MRNIENVTQLPDAQRRLEICESSFRRSYGENMNRLIALKGNACPERALIMRLHLLQGVVLFHQNQRNEAYEKLVMASGELSELKVDDTSVQTLVEMGFEPFEARLGLRACTGNLEQAINFIQERKEKVREARIRSEKERHINKKLTQESEATASAAADKNWVNPRSVCTLMEMGFERAVVVEALKQSKNDVGRALDLLQTQAAELRQNLPPAQIADKIFIEQLKQLGFNEEMARVALETTQNNIEKSIDFLVKIFGNEEDLRKTMERLAETADQTIDLSAASPSTSSGGGATSLVAKVITKAKAELESLKAYKRFNEDLTENEQDYLDLPLVQEEQLLAEYKRLLEQ